MKKVWIRPIDIFKIFVLWKIYFPQSVSISINRAILKWTEFWWSDKPTFITPSWDINSGRLANMWSINNVLLQFIRVGDFTICVKPNTVQNWGQFLTSLETVADTKVLLLNPALFWFWYKFILKSLRMYKSFLGVSSLAKFSFRVCRKLFWLGGR